MYRSSPLARPRKRKFQQLPPGVYFDRCRYVLRRLNGEPVKPPVRLAADDAPLTAVWRAYHQYIGRSEGTIEWLCDEFMSSQKWQGFKTHTRYQWTKYKNNICGAVLSDSSRLGALELHKVTPGLLRGYLDARSAPVMANRELGFLSSVFAWGIGRDLVRNEDGRVLLENPCKAVERNKEAPRSRYIADDEYRRLIEYAPIRVQIAMELAYLCRMRRGEVLSAKKSQILPEGFDTLRTKGSKDAVTQWSPRLRQAVEAALSLPGVDSVYLLHDKRGQPIKDTTLNAAFQKTKRAARLMDLTFHDIKAKGVSDATGSKKDAGGHKSEAMVLVYDRKKLVVPPTR